MGNLKNIQNLAEAASQLENSGVGKAVKELLFGKEAQVDNTSRIGMKMYGGKDVSVSPLKSGGAFLKIPDAYGNGKDWGIGLSQKDYNKFLALDDSHRHQFLESYVERYNPELYNKLKLSEASDLHQRASIRSPYTSDGVGIRYPEDRNPALDPDNWRYKHYPDQKLDPRISKVTPAVDENTVYLNMTIDGKERNITVSNKNTVEAFHAGILPLNVLANKVLELYDKQQMDVQARFDMGLDAQRSQDQSLSQGFHR